VLEFTALSLQETAVQDITASIPEISHNSRFSRNNFVSYPGEKSPPSVLSVYPKANGFGGYLADFSAAPKS
jgi:hypothetical protein